MWKHLGIGGAGARQNDTTLIAAGATVEGAVYFAGILELEGVVNGSINARGDDHAVVRILPGGQVRGDVSAPVVVVNGTVTGNVYSSEHVELAAGAIVSGDVQYSLIEMTKGAQVNGRLQFREDGASLRVDVRSDLPQADGGRDGAHNS
jgi:cytoskeletal protein CcmA (bactofilin family)